MVVGRFVITVVAEDLNEAFPAECLRGCRYGTG